MYDENDKKLLSNLCKDINLKFFISFTILIVCIITIAIAIYYPSIQKLPEPINVLDVTEENIYSKITVSLLTDEFATYSDDNGAIKEKYYFVSDGTYLYIVNLSSSLFTSLSNINKYTYGELEYKPDDIVITGISEYIPKELKDIALETYNTWFTDSDITSENFEDYFGIYLLNTKKLPLSDTLNTIITIASMIFIFNFVFLIIFTTNYFKSRKTLKRVFNEDNFQRIIQNYNDPEKTVLEKEKVIFTKEFIFSYSSFLIILEYKDILWIYPFIQKKNSIEVSRSIIATNKVGKKFTIYTISSNKKNILKFENIYSKLVENCPNALLGYTKENILATNKKNLSKTREEFETKNIL